MKQKTLLSFFFPFLILALAGLSSNLQAVPTIQTIAGNGTAGYSGDGGPASSAMINSPIKGVLDAAGNYYFADRSNNRIRKIDTSGNISTFAGSGIAGFSGDGGPATLAALNTPLGLGFDAAGNLYIPDARNYRIRKVDTSGNITTVAGNGTPGY